MVKKIFRDMRRYFKHEDQYLEALAIGMNSYVDRDGDEHILFLDYDKQDFSLVEKSIKELQSQFKLSHAFIYKTRKGFHAFFFYDNDLPYSRIKFIINYAKHVDPLFKIISKYYKHKTIRVAGKYKQSDIQYYKTIRGNKPDPERVAIGELKRTEYNTLKGFHTLLRSEGGQE